MKRIFTFFISALIMVACSESEVTVSPITPTSADVIGAQVGTMSIDMTEDRLDSQTRGTTSYSSNGVVYQWENGDQLVVFPTSDDKKTSEFEENKDNTPNEYNPDGSPVTDNNNNTAVKPANGEAVSTYTLVMDSQKEGGQAYFDGGGFKLDATSNYFAFAPYIQKEIDGDPRPYVNINTSDKKNIRISYKGQRQVANGDNSHLNAYDYLAAYGEVTGKGSVNFAFKRVGRLIRIRVVTNDVDDEHNEVRYYKRLEIRSKKPSFRFYPERTVDLTTGETDPAKLSADTYIPVAKTLDDDNGETCYALDLGPEGGVVEDGVTHYGLKVKNYKNVTANLLVLYMMIPADNFLGEQFIGALIAEDETEHYINLAGKDFTLNNAVSYGPTAVEAGHLSINVRANKHWQLGTTVAQSRAKGDPGVDENLEEPDHLYIYALENNVLKPVLKAKKGQAKDVENGWSEWKGWNDTGDEWVYKGDFQVEYDKNTATNLKTYIVAYKGNDDLSDVSDESEILALSMSCPGTDQESDQTKLRNIYSYSYSLNPQNEPPVINGMVYHTAAKLDVQWNSTSPLTVGVGKVVSVTNSPSSLKIFAPQTNTAGSVTYSTPLTTGTMYNGRAVFYVPQIGAVDGKVTYNVVVESPSDPATNDNVVFTPSLTNGWTSWFKANIRK